MSAADPIRLWFVLVDKEGRPYKQSSASSVYLTRNCHADVDEFRKKVRQEFADSLLQGVASCVLKVYKNKNAFEHRIHRLKEDANVTHLGISKSDALCVVVPDASQADSNDDKVENDEEERDRVRQELRSHMLMPTRDRTIDHKNGARYEKVGCYVCRFARIRTKHVQRHVPSTSMGCIACGKAFHMECFFLYHQGPDKFSAEAKRRYNAVIAHEVNNPKDIDDYKKSTKDCFRAADQCIFQCEVRE